MKILIWFSLLSLSYVHAGEIPKKAVSPYRVSKKKNNASDCLAFGSACVGVACAIGGSLLVVNGMPQGLCCGVAGIGILGVLSKREETKRKRD